MAANLNRAPFLIIITVSSSVSAFATDYFVDVTNGSDAATGTSAASAWKTLTFASVTAGSGSANTIHVAPGTYSSASGEIFPLQFAGQHLVGDAGSASTILDGSGTATLVSFYNAPAAPVPNWLASMRGFTCRNASRCLFVSWGWSSITVTLEDLNFENAIIAGVSLSTGGFSGSGSNYHFTLSRCRFANCAVGLQAGGPAGPNSLAASDCVYDGAGNVGVDLSAGGTLDARLDRWRIAGAAIAGIRASATNSGHLTTLLFDCLVAKNAAGYLSATGLNGFVASTLTRCTIASNSNQGIGAQGGSAGSAFALTGTLVWGNGVDYSSAAAPASSFSQIGGANPLFRDPANGDYRVYFGSSVIDTGDPSTPVGALDLNSVPRSIDGDLDTLERADIGCFEFRPLDITTTGQQGTLLELEIFGPAGGTSMMRLSRGSPGAPVMTPFGELDLNPAVPWVTFATAPGPGTPFLRPIPATPIFIGQTYSFQGLVSSSASPVGSAWSNAVSFTIRP